MTYSPIPRPPHFKTRGQWDASIWHCIADANEYELPAQFEPGDVVIDVGAHIGCFSVVALELGAHKVLAYEPEPRNIALLRENLAPYLNVEIHDEAVWRSDEPSQTLHLAPHPNPLNNAGWRVLGSEGIPVQTVAFDDVVSEAIGHVQPGDRIRLLKLDCEGSEFPILLTSHMLDKVEEITGEYHLFTDWGHFDGSQWNLAVLRTVLEDRGFTFSSLAINLEQGFFHARRGDENA